MIPCTKKETCQLELNKIRTVIIQPPITPKGGERSIIDITTDFYLGELNVSTNKGTYIVIKTQKKPLANREKH